MQTANENFRKTAFAAVAKALNWEVEFKWDMPSALRLMGFAIIVLGVIAAVSIWPPSYSGPRGFYSARSGGMGFQHWTSIGAFALSLVIGMVVTGIGMIMHDVRKTRASLAALLEHHGIAQAPESQPAPVATPAE